MAPGWTSFLRTNGIGSSVGAASGSGAASNTTSSSNSTPARYPPPSTPRDKSLPRPPEDIVEPPKLVGRDGERAVPSPSQDRPHIAATPSDRQHRHNRSVSQPLPKLFGRKKSTGNLNVAPDLTLDEGLVPVLDEVYASSSVPTPTRVISGKKKNAARSEEDDDKTQRKCMCCASKVKVPKELDKFRCMACLCINDLQSVEEQKALQRQRQLEKARRAERNTNAGAKGKRATGLEDNFVPEPVVPPLSVGKTQAIINRCILAYLESRCASNIEQPFAQSSTQIRPNLPLQTPEERDDPLNHVSPRSESPGQLRAPDLAISQSSPTIESDRIRRDPVQIHNIPVDFPSSSFVTDDVPTLRGTPQGPGPPYIPRKAVPRQPDRKPPPPPIAPGSRVPSQNLKANGFGHSDGHPNAEHSPRPLPSPRLTPQGLEARRRHDRAKVIFKDLEDYIVTTFGDLKALNCSFCTVKMTHVGRARSESNIITPPSEQSPDTTHSPVGLSQLDAKMLLLGDIGENGTWWTGKLSRNEADRAALKRKKVGEGSRRMISSKSPNINWIEARQWYRAVHNAGFEWRRTVVSDEAKAAGITMSALRQSGFSEIESDLAQAREHTIRALLKVTENLLKRPGRLLTEPEELRWLLIILENPSFYPYKLGRKRPDSVAATAVQNVHIPSKQSHLQPPSPSRSPKKSLDRGESLSHSGLLKRTFGLLAGTPDICHRYLIGWFARTDETQFVDLVDLVAKFVTYRLSRRSSKSHHRKTTADGGLIPDLSQSAMSTSAQLHSAMGLSGSIKKLTDDPDQEPEYVDDWQIRAGAKVMSLLFAANSIWQGQRYEGNQHAEPLLHTLQHARGRRNGQLLQTSTFYNTLLDYRDILADFKTWETKRDRFAFCQYPFFLSMGSKIKILEYDARRQMEIKAREAYFDSVIRHRVWDGHFHMRVRRDCMVDDSLRQISEAVGSGPDELKKGLRVHFTGEEGVDAGGPRKEWFLLLVRDIFDPNHGLFVYDDESNTCYFNPNSFETSDQYYLVGALLGLAIYNSTILDIALPPFAFRKLLAAAPAPAPGTGSAPISSVTGTKGQITYTISDLAEFRPSLAAGLRQLLEFDGDVQETYCWNFVAPVDRYGTVVEVPLVSNGEGTPVTNANRQEFVDAYVRYLLDTSVSRQFEPFKRGFFQVCAGNALSLFRAEEIELLVRGSDEALDVDSLRGVAVYENWRSPVPPHTALTPETAAAEPVVVWFWEIFAVATPDRQRSLLSFLTGTDRIPAVGATSLVLRIMAGADTSAPPTADERARYPTARTCFNMLVLWRYESREQLEQRLWRAVDESEGFGLK